MNRKKMCPECGSELELTIIKDFFGERKVEMCTGLVEIDVNKPLEACTYGRDVETEPITEIVPGYSGRGIFKKV